MPLGAPTIYRNLRRWLGSIGIDLAKAPVTRQAEFELDEPADAIAAAAAEAGALAPGG